MRLWRVCRADVAQLVEQRFRKPQVTGSNPVVGSIANMSVSPRHPLVSIIVPTRNEAENIAPLVEQIVSSAAPFHEILFVDDDSTDGTRNAVRLLAASYPIRLIEQDRAEVGLAAAIMSGARAAQGEILLVMDADLSHPPERIKDLLAPLFAGTAVSTKMRCSQITGVACPSPGRATFHLTFLPSAQRSGGLPCRTRPFAVGPRHCGQLRSSCSGFAARAEPASRLLRTPPRREREE